MDRKEFLKGSCCLMAAIPASSALPYSAAIPDSIKSILDDKKTAKLTPLDKRVDFSKIWVKRFFDIMDTQLDESTRTRIMEICGRECHIGAHGVKNEGSDQKLNDFIKWFQGFAGEEYLKRDGDKIYFSYYGNPDGLKVSDGYCLCPLVEDGPKDLSPTYCICSVGYVGEMFKEISGRQTKVKLLASLRRGDNKCSFEITLI